MKRIMLLFYGVISGGVNFTALPALLSCYNIGSGQGKQLCRTDLKIHRSKKESEREAVRERCNSC